MSPVPAPDTGAFVVLVSVPRGPAGPLLARQLVEERLAACATLLPGARSIYRWQGAVEEAEEELLLLKTTADLAPRLEDAVRRLHPYEVPEILALPVAMGNAAYLAWLRASVAEGERA